MAYSWSVPTVVPTVPSMIYNIVERKDLDVSLFRVKIVETQEWVQGRSVSSVARSVFGRGAEVQPDSGVKGLYEVMGQASSPESGRPVLGRLYADPRDSVPFDTVTEGQE